MKKISLKKNKKTSEKVSEKKKLPAIFSEKKKLPAIFSRKKKLPAESGRERKVPALFRGKIKIIAVILILIMVIGILGGFVFLKKAPEGKTDEGKKTESVEGKEKEETAESEIKEKSKIKAEDIDLGELENHLASDFIRILRSEQYLIRYKTTTVYNGESFEVETTYAVSGDATALASADRATIVRGGKVYVLNHSDMSMISWDVTDSDNLKRIDTTDMVYLGSSEPPGLVCEEYSTATAGLKFYFKDSELVKLETSINKKDVAMDIIEVGGKAPENLFAVPPNYRNTNITDIIEAERP